MSEATMDVAADEAQELARMLRDSARDFAQARLGRAQRATPADADTAVSAAWREMTALGWLGLLVATAHGGSGLGMAEMAVVLEELGRVASCEPLAATGVLAVQAIAGSDQAALRARLLEGLVQGEELPALAWQEHARLQADDATSSLRAESSAQGWRLSGGKRFVQPGTGWSGLVLPVQRDDGLALLWLPRATPGLTVQPARLADGSGCADLRCDGVLLAEPQWLASPAVAAQALQQALAWGRLAAAAELLGVVRGALAMLTEQLRTRVQFGVPIGSFQGLRHRAADLFVQQELVSAAVQELCTLVDGGAVPHLAAQAARVKARASSAALLATKEAVQMHGAMGYTDECDVGLYLKRALVLSAWLGNATELRTRHAAESLNLETEAS
jgi:alkylation response protein AidB-like acyl-CoA dehydrogenase